MHSPHPAIMHLFAALATSLITAVWQGVLLILGTVLCLKLLPASTATARSFIWTMIFVVAALLPFGNELLARSRGVVGHHSDIHLGMKWAFALLAVWGVLSLYRVTQLIRSAYRVRRLAKDSRPLVHELCLAPLLTLGLQAGSRRNVLLCISDEISVPSVVGFLKPRILLPSALFEKMSLSDVRQIVLHEMEHLRRHDDWKNLLQKLALAFFPLNPVLFWIERRLCVEREFACDDGVLCSTGASKAYATCLVNLAEQSLLRGRMMLALTAWQRRSELSRRIERILNAPQRSAKSRMSVGSVGSVAIMMACAVLILLQAPQRIIFTSGYGEQTIQAANDVARGAAPAFAMAMRPTFVKATMPEMRRTSPTKPRHTAQPHLLYAVAPLRRQTTRPRLVLSFSEAFAAPHMTLAVSEDSQFTYAAVPVRDGWLIFQL